MVGIIKGLWVQLNKGGTWKKKSEIKKSNLIKKINDKQFEWTWCRNDIAAMHDSCSPFMFLQNTKWEMETTTTR